MVKKPQPLAHTCQSTPACVESFATAALRLMVASVCICDGRDGMKWTASVVSGVMEIGFELRVTDGSLIEVAIKVTDVPEEVTGGAV